MPKHRTEDAIHVVMTDHLIRKDPAPEEWLEPRKERPTHAFRAPQPYVVGPNMDKETVSLYIGMLGAPLGTTARLEAFRKTMDEMKPEGADVQLYRGQLEQDAGNYEQAEKFFRGVTEKFPQRYGGYVGLAAVLIQQGRNEEAVDVARRAVELDSIGVDGYRLLGSALLALNRVSEAGPMFQRAVQLRPYQSGLRAGLAAAFALVGNLEASVKESKAALAVNPLDVKARIDLVPVLAYLERWDEAVDLLNDGIGLQPKAAPIQEVLAMVLALQDDFEGAMLACKQARSVGADDSICSMVETLVYDSRGDMRKAIVSYQTAIDQVKGKSNVNYLVQKLMEKARIAIEG